MAEGDDGVARAEAVGSSSSASTPQVIAGMTDHDEVPFAEARKVDSLIEDLDGNVFADLVSAWGAAPYGATPADIVEAVTAAQRRYGMEITNYIPNQPALDLAERLLVGRTARHHPSSAVAEWHPRRRNRRQACPGVDRPTDDPDLPRAVPR